MTDATASAPRELPVLVGHGAGEPESLLLIGAPEGERVLVRRWSADDWSRPPAPEWHDAMALLGWVEAQAARGRTLNQSLYGVRLWLRGEGTEFRSR